MFKDSSTVGLIEVGLAVAGVVEGLEGVLPVARRASGQTEIELAVAHEDRQRAGREVRGGNVEIAISVPVTQGDPPRAPGLGNRYRRVEGAVAATAHDESRRAAVRHRQVVVAVAPVRKEFVKIYNISKKNMCSHRHLFKNNLNYVHFSRCTSAIRSYRVL